LIEYAHTPWCTIKTLEIWHSKSDISTEDIERIRSSGVVDNISFFIIDKVSTRKGILH
jgi:hypothetical protein